MIYTDQHDLESTLIIPAKGRQLASGSSPLTAVSKPIRDEYCEELLSRARSGAKTVMAHVVDFDFRNLTKFLKLLTPPQLGNYNNQTGGCRLQVILSFKNSHPNGEQVGKWIKFVQSLYRKANAFDYICVLGDVVITGREYLINDLTDMCAQLSSPDGKKVKAAVEEWLQRELSVAGGTGNKQWSAWPTGGLVLNEEMTEADYEDGGGFPAPLAELPTPAPRDANSSCTPQ